MNPAAMTAILVVLPGIFAWSAIRRFKLAAIGTPEPRFTYDAQAIQARIRDTIIYAFGQKRMPYYPLAGIAHMMIFGGFMVLLLNSIMLWGRGYDPFFDFWGLLSVHQPIGALYSIVKEVFAVLVILGASVFVYYRVFNKQKRMTLGIEGLVILGIIITMMLADLLYVGSSHALAARMEGRGIPVFAIAEPVGSVWGIGLGLAGFEAGTLNALRHLGFWWHASFVLIFLNILPYSKHFHILTAIPNVFARNLTPHKLPTTEDLEGKVEREEPIGYAKITDLTWKDVLDLYTCTECGRCSDNCPAYTTDKKLSPKHLTLALRDHLYASETALLGSDTANPAGEGETTGDGRHEMHHAEPPKDAYYVASKPISLVGGHGILDPDVIWSCTTCRACEEQCPVMISYVDKIVQMRRHVVMLENEFPAELQKPFNGLETNSNPWNLSSMDRANWAEGLGVPTLAEKGDAEVLYWVGCSASYDDRAKKIARATATLLKHAGVDFAILGKEECCTGDPARRAGNEYLFQTIAQGNVETLNGYEVGKKTVVTTCPHCFNALKNEYPDFGGNYEVVHHSTFLAKLIDEKRIVPTKKHADGPITFHDSCYLGRYNDVYDAPRKVLQSIPGVELREPEYWTKNKGLCCGAGGAQMFMEETGGTRVNKKRTLQLLDTGAKTISSGCPFCMTMLTDGLKGENQEEHIRQKDIAEILLESIESPQPVAAE